MFKTMALFFVLGLMVSCASHHHDRSISSVAKDKDVKSEHRFDPGNSGAMAR